MRSVVKSACAYRDSNPVGEDPPQITIRSQLDLTFPELLPVTAP